MWLVIWNTQATPQCELSFTSGYSWPSAAKMAFLFKEVKNSFTQWLTWYDFNEWLTSASYSLKTGKCYLSAFLETAGQNFQTWVEVTLTYSDRTNTGDDFQMAWEPLINQIYCHILSIHIWKETYTQGNILANQRNASISRWPPLAWLWCNNKTSKYYMKT